MRKPVLPLMAAALAMAAPVPVAAQGLSLGSLFSCPDANGRTGAIVGGIAGALAGSQISRNERTLGAVVGAGLGAWAGNQIACRMNNAGRDQAQTAVEQALNTGRPQTWRDARTGATGRVEVVSNGFDDRYAAAPSAGDYTSNVSATNLRYARGVPDAPSVVQPTGRCERHQIGRLPIHARHVPTWQSAQARGSRIQHWRQQYQACQNVRPHPQTLPPSHHVAQRRPARAMHFVPTVQPAPQPLGRLLGGNDS